MALTGTNWGKTPQRRLKEIGRQQKWGGKPSEEKAKNRLFQKKHDDFRRTHGRRPTIDEAKKLWNEFYN